MILLSVPCATQAQLHHRHPFSTGYIAQWLERLTADQQVPGSNPGVPSTLYFIAAHMNPAASLSVFFGQTCSAANVDLAQRFEWLIADQQDVSFVPPCFQGLTIKVSLSFWPLFCSSSEVVSTVGFFFFDSLAGGGKDCARCPLLEAAAASSLNQLLKAGRGC